MSPIKIDTHSALDKIASVPTTELTIPGTATTYSRLAIPKHEVIVLLAPVYLDLIEALRPLSPSARLIYDDPFPLPILDHNAGSTQLPPSFYALDLSSGELATRVPYAPFLSLRINDAHIPTITDGIADEVSFPPP